MVTQPNSEKARRVFVLADTHNRLPESVREMANGADEIWHLGDVCAETILDELRAIGVPVVLVRGNCDSNFEWPLVIDIVRGGLKFRCNIYRQIILRIMSMFFCTDIRMSRVAKRVVALGFLIRAA